MKALIQTGSSLSACGHAQAGGRVPVPHEKRFLINKVFVRGGVVETDAVQAPISAATPSTQAVPRGPIVTLPPQAPPYQKVQMSGRVGSNEAVPVQGSEGVKPTAVDANTSQPEAVELAKVKGDVINNYPVKDIIADPVRLQFRMNFTESGASGSLKGIKVWDRGRSGVWDVWRDPKDGKTYVVNGHNRLDAAKRLGVKAADVRFINVQTPEEARAYGALINIAGGNGTALDAAKYFRDVDVTPEEFAAMNLPVTQRMSQDGYALSRLAQPFFDAVVRGDLAQHLAIRIGQELPDAGDQQTAVNRIKQRKGNMTVGYLNELMDDIKAAPTARAQGMDTIFLPGMEPSKKDIKLSDISIKIKTIINRRLSSDKKLFGRVSSTQAQSRLEEAGNKIDAETNKQISAEAAIVQEVFNKLKNTRDLGPILSKATEDVYNGQDINTVVKKTYESVRAKVYEALGRSDGTGDGGGEALAGNRAGVSQEVPGENVSQKPVGAQPFELKPPTPEELAAERAARERQAQQDALKEGVSRPIVANDKTGRTADMFGGGDTPLFNERRDTPPSTSGKPKPGAGPKGGFAEPVGRKTLPVPAVPTAPGMSAKAIQAQHTAQRQALEAELDAKLEKLKAPTNADQDTLDALAEERKLVRREYAQLLKAQNAKQQDELYQSQAALRMAAEETGKMPTSFGRAQIARKDAIKRQFSQMHGLGPEVGRAAEDLRDAKEAAKILGRYYRISILSDDSGKRLFKPVQEGQVLELAQQVQDGKLTLDQFKAQLNLPDSHPTVRAMRQQDADRAAFRSAMERYSAGWPAALRKTVLEDATYMTRFYERHVMSSTFEPDPKDVMAAITAVSRDIAGSVENVLGRLRRVSGPRTPFNVYEFMETGDQSLISHLSSARQARALAVRRQYSAMRDLIEWQSNRDPQSAMANVRAVHAAARGDVDYWLGRTEEPGMGRSAAGGLSLANLQRRVLSDVFRKLYGEIGDAGFRAQRTAEVQGDMLARSVFLQRAMAEGRGTVWVDQRIGEKDAFVHKLGDSPRDRIKYGPLAGKYVNQAMMDVLEAPERHSAAIRAFQSVMSYTRLTKVLQARTAIRNYLTNYEYAVLSGDIFLKTYASRLVEAHKLMIGYALGKPWAVKQVSELTRLGAFRPSASTTTMDLEVALGGASKAGQAEMAKVARSYSFIDAMTKWAAYQARVDDGMTPEEAREHVRSHYQNRDRVPGAVKVITSAGGPDYLGFTVDSIRIMGEGARAAANGMMRGDFRPVLGNMLFYGLRAALVSASTMGVGKYLKQIWEQAHRQMRGKEDENEIVDLQEAQIGAVRELLPGYDRASPMWVWQENNKKTGKPNAVFVTMLSGQTALPMLDWAQGTLQVQQQGGSWLEAAGQHMAELAKPAMIYDFAVKATTGRTLEGRYANPTGKGLMDMIRNPDDPEIKKIIKGVATTGLADFAPFGLAQPLNRIQQMQEKEAAGQIKGGLYARSATAEDATWSALRYMRTQRIERGDFQAMFRDTVRQHVENLKQASTTKEKAQREKILKGAATAAQEADAREVNQMKYVLKIRETVEAARTAFPKEWTSRVDMQFMLSEMGLNQSEIYTILSDRNQMIPNARPPVNRRDLLLERRYRQQ